MVLLIMCNESIGSFGETFGFCTKNVHITSEMLGDRVLVATPFWAFCFFAPQPAWFETSCHKWLKTCRSVYIRLLLIPSVRRILWAVAALGECFDDWAQKPLSLHGYRVSRIAATDVVRRSAMLCVLLQCHIGQTKTPPIRVARFLSNITTSIAFIPC